MAAKKKRSPSPKAIRAAKALTEPPPEMQAMAHAILRVTESIIRLEATVDLLVKAVCSETRRNMVLHRVTRGSSNPRRKSHGS